MPPPPSTLKHTCPHFFVEKSPFSYELDTSKLSAGKYHFFVTSKMGDELNISRDLETICQLQTVVVNLHEFKFTWISVSKESWGDCLIIAGIYGKTVEKASKTILTDRACVLFPGADHVLWFKG